MPVVKLREEIEFEGPSSKAFAEGLEEDGE